jgi:drug/metabolite transporter (DMT)-like permease
MVRHASIAIGVGAALVATLMVSSGLVLQALEARGIEHRHGLRLTMMGRLLRRKRWVIGTLIGYFAFPFQLLALAHAPLVVVQPVHATGLLVVLAAGVRMLRERIGAAESGGVLAIITGIAMLAWGAPPGRDRETNQAAYAGVTALLVAVELLPFLLRGRSGRATLLLCAGAGFAAVNVAVKGFSDHVDTQEYAVAVGYLAVAAFASLTALLTQATAFQRHPAVDVVPVIFALTNFLPVVLGLLVLDEHWGKAALAGVPFAVGACLLLVGTGALARAKPVVGVMRQAAGEAPGTPGL